MKKIYLVTVVEYAVGSIVDPKTGKGLEPCDTRRERGTRCWAWYATEKAAKEAIAVNDCDMREDCYNYLVLETMHEGGLQCAYKDYKKQWYHWVKNKKDGKWKSCPEPKWAEGTFCWSIG